MKRNPDGTWRNARHPIVVSNRMSIAHWVTAEILALQTKGPEHGSDRGSHQPGRPRPGAATVSLTDGIVFPADYRISESAVFKAYHKAMDRQPAIEAEVYRKEDTARLEEMYLKLQPGISNGDPRHIDTAVRVLAHKAKLNGYAVEPEQVSSLSSFQIIIHLDGKDGG